MLFVPLEHFSNQGLLVGRNDRVINALEVNTNALLAKMLQGPESRRSLNIKCHLS